MYADSKQQGRFIAQLREEAKNGDPERLYELGIALGREEKEVLQDEAGEALLLAARKGHKEACYALAQWYRRERPEDEAAVADALPWYVRGAELGSRQAMRALALLYAKGIGVRRDEEKAAVWLRQLAEDDAEAALTLADFCRQGRLSSAGEADAFAFWRSWALKGDKRAAFLLATAYAKGIGTAKDERLGRRWMTAAAIKGSREALEALHYTVDERLLPVELGGREDPLPEPKKPQNAAPAMKKQEKKKASRIPIVILAAVFVAVTSAEVWYLRLRDAGKAARTAVSKTINYGHAQTEEESLPDTEAFDESDRLTASEAISEEEIRTAAATSSVIDTSYLYETLLTYETPSTPHFTDLHAAWEEDALLIRWDAEGDIDAYRLEARSATGFTLIAKLPAENTIFSYTPIDSYRPLMIRITALRVEIQDGERIETPLTYMVYRLRTQEG